MEENTDNFSEGGLAESPGSSVTSTGGTELPVLLDIDEIFEALDHFRRRYLAFSLLFENQPIDLVDAARELYAWEESVPLDAVDEADLTEVATALYHVHVPKLRELGIVTYDEDERTLEPGQNTAHVEALVQASSSFDRAETAYEQYNTEGEDAH